MRIPARIQDLLSKNTQLEAAVKLSITQLEPWIQNSNLPFFPEYTKHDIGHIELVLQTASSLIRDEAWQELTSGDAAALCIAVLLHDCAMHITEDGFVALLSETRSDLNVSGMEDRPWLVLWEDFLGEASRFDGRKLIKLFGHSTPTRRPPLIPSQMTKDDRLLIGEFLRRHHPRLAQEIAHFGVPAKGPHFLSLQGFTDLCDHIPPLAGLIARSHGGPLRNFYKPVSKFGIRDFRGVHSIFLMCLLRIADYLQVDAERAPAQMLRVRTLASPISEGEWKAHHAIRDVRLTHDDPEAIFIDAAPDDVHTFWKVQSWLKGIQQEMDSSWAVLGEIYGRFGSNAALGLQLRRVRSTLDDIACFEAGVNYLPVAARFRSADADLLKLLIEPLYGDRPEVGLRELIQNAVDAVREAAEYAKGTHNPQASKITNSQKSDVIVSIDEKNPGEFWVTISDNGIGMSPNVILDYFLTAGASFRRSEEWRKLFETTDGKSRVLRAGRFGVGALAGFLLGPEMRVSTRHIDASHGVEFTASVESDLIELRKCTRAQGTTIHIQISPDIAKRLSQVPDKYSYESGWHRSPERAINWDWYCLDKPSVARFVNNLEMPQKFNLPDCNTTFLPADWRRISHQEYEDIIWTYAKAPRLCCNGIRIESSINLSEAKWDYRYGVTLPNLAVWDPNGKLPLNLQRTGLSSNNFPFEETLVADIINDFISFTLKSLPSRPPSRENIYHWCSFAQKYPGLSRNKRWNPNSNWFLTDNGIGYLDSHLITLSGCKSVLLLRGTDAFFKDSDALPLQGQAVIPSCYDGNLTSFDSWIRRVLDVVRFDSDPEFHNAAADEINVIAALNNLGVRVLLSPRMWERSCNKLPAYLAKSIKVELSSKKNILISLGRCPPDGLKITSMVDSLNFDHTPLGSCAEFYTSKTATQQTPIGTRWLDLFGRSVIPYEVDSRKKLLGKSYEILSSHIQLHEIADSIKLVEGASDSQNE